MTEVDSVSIPTSPPTLRIFGGIGIDVAGEPVSIGGPRQRRLLALLAVRAGSIVDIDWLAEHLWDDDDRPAGATPALRTYMSRLRQALPEVAQSWVETEQAGYRLSAPSTVIESEHFSALRAEASDARQRADPIRALELLDEALELWRGEPFREVEDVDAARLVIEQLNIDRLEMLEERWEAALALGRHTQITGELAAFTSEHGLRDRAARQYALALHRSGRTPEALRTLDNHRRTIADETGLTPSPAVVELEQALLDGDPSLLLEASGRPLRGYRLIEEAGVGAFAVVWRAIQPSVNRAVAVKQIRAELASQPEFIRRFEAEANLVARIEHPHIVPLIDFWRDPDSAYLVMRWLSGGTLERKLDDGPLSVSNTLVLARQIGSALAAAHSQGVIHRDVKTGNILFDDVGNAFLGDFGIALEASQSDGPEAALSPGSPAYSSPEQIRRQQLGPEADIFSLAVVIHECLIGALPFGAMAVNELIDRQLNEPYPPLADLRTDIPDSLSAAVAKATAKEPADRYSTVAEFLDALDPGAAHIETRQPRAVGDATNPYKGLRAFDDADADEFFGRERLTSELLDRLSGTDLTSRALIVVGPSGSGKSSVVRAGLVPAIRDGAVPGSSDWFTSTLVPGTDPFESLEVALLRIAVNPPATLLDQLKDGPRGILRGARRCLASDDARILLVIDQFEELFTGSAAEDATHFLDALTAAVTDPTSPIRLVCTLRADYYDRPLAHPGFAQVLKDAAVDVTPLAPDELERAMVEPVRSQGVAFEPGLVARIAAETLGQPAPLPLLQYALSELFDRREGDQLTVAGYEEVGGLSGALAARAEAIHNDADDAQRAALRRIFGKMTNPAEQSTDLRRRVPVVELGDDAATHWVVETLGAARLVSFDRDPATRDRTIEVAHEALLREWPRLVDWLQADLDLLRSVDAISRAADTWADGGRAVSDLYRGDRLSNAVGLVSSALERLRPLDTEFVEASRAAAEAERDDEQRRIRRLRRLVSAVAVALLVAILAGGLALRAQQRANDEAEAARESAATAEDQTVLAEREAASALAASEEAEEARDAAELATEQAELATLISRSAAEISQDAELALLLALEAHQRESRPDTQQAVLNALTANRRANNISEIDLVQRFGDECPEVYSPGSTVEYRIIDGALSARDLQTGAVTTHGPPPEECVVWFLDEELDRRWAASGDGLRVWTASIDGPWELHRTFEEPAYLGSFEFRPNGVLAYLSNPGEDAELLLVDDTTGEDVGEPMDVGGVALTEVSEDGSLIVASLANSQTSRGTLALFDGNTGRELWAQTTVEAPTAIAFDLDSGRVLSGFSDGTITSTSISTGEVVSVLPTTASDPIADIGIRPDGLIVAATLTVVELVDPRTGPIGAAFDLPTVARVAVRADGTVLTTSFETNTLAVVDLDVSVLAESALWIEPGSVVTMSGDDVGVTVPSSGIAERIDLLSGDRSRVELATPDGPRFSADAVFADETGLWAIDEAGVLARWEQGGYVEQFDTGDGYVAGSRRGDLFSAVSGDPGSRRATLHSLVPGASGPLFDADVPDAILAHPLDGGGMVVLDASGDLVEFDANAEAGRTVDTGVVDATLLSLDATGSILSVASPSGGLEVVDMETGEVISLPDAGVASGVGFADDGHTVIVTTLDGTVRLWDVTSRSSAGTLWSGSGAVVGSPSWFDPTTGSIWVGSSGRILQIPRSPDSWVERACDFLTRDLTESEWDRLVPGDTPQRSSCRPTVLGPEWEQGANGRIPPGTIRLPEFGGIQFDLDTERMVYQDRAFTILRTREEPSAVEVNLLAPAATPGGPPLTTIEELIAALTDVVGADLTEVEPIETPLGIARTFDFELDMTRVDPSTAGLEVGESGWGPWSHGRFSLLDTERGLFMVTAETQDPLSEYYPETVATADTILATLQLIEL